MTTDTNNKKPSFTLSKSNKICLLIIIVIVAVANTWLVMQAVKTGNASQDAISEMTGTLIGVILGRFIMIPGFFAYLTWWIRGRKEKAGTMVFNIVLFVMLAYSFVTFGVGAS